MLLPEVANDLTLGGAKVGGILAESSVSAEPTSSGGPRVDHAVIGVGVNLHAPPSVAGAAGLGDRVDPMKLLTEFISRFRIGYTPASPGFATATAGRCKSVRASSGCEPSLRLASDGLIKPRASLKPAA